MVDVDAILSKAITDEQSDERVGKEWQAKQSLRRAVHDAWVRAECIVMPNIANDETITTYISKLVDEWLSIGQAIKNAGLESEYTIPSDAPDWYVVSLTVAQAAIADDRKRMTAILTNASEGNLWLDVRQWLRTGKPYPSSVGVDESTSGRGPGAEKQVDDEKIIAFVEMRKSLTWIKKAEQWTAEFPDDPVSDVAFSKRYKRAVQDSPKKKPK